MATGIVGFMPNWQADINSLMQSSSPAFFEAERCYRQAQQLYLLEGDDQAALAAVDLALRVCPVKAKAMVLKAEILFSLGSYKTALSVIEDAIVARPGWAEPYLSKTNILAVLGRYSDANAACTEGMERVTEKSRYLMPSFIDQKISILLRLRRFREVTAMLNAASELLSDAEYAEVLNTYEKILAQHRPPTKSSQAHLRIV